MANMDTRVEVMIINRIADLMKEGVNPDEIVERLNAAYDTYTFTYDVVTPIKKNSIKLYWQYTAKPVTLCDITIIPKGDSNTAS